MKRIVIIGGGAAGLAAAISSSEKYKNQAEVTLIEKNERPARKVMITGKGRCNVTNNCNVDTLIANVPKNGKFLYSAFSGFTPKDVISFFDPAGNGSTIVTHRVTAIVEENGEIAFRTKGDFNNTEDKLAVPGESLVGIYQSRIPKAGNVAMFMQTTTGLIVCVVLPIVLLVAYDVIRRSIYEKNKKADTDALLAELEALRAEKAKAAVSAENSENE